MTDKVDKPAINVCVNKPCEELLTEVLAGLEEESIPYKVIKKDFTDDCLIKETYNASSNSKLGIAIGVYENKFAVHYNKLKESKPLFFRKLQFYEKNKARRIGCNAARLYKIMPLKKLELDEEEELINTIKSHVIAALNVSLP